MNLDVTKDENGRITIWKHSPKVAISAWIPQHPAFDDRLCIGCLKLAEFEHKDWTECIYEVPRKTTGEIEKFDTNLSSPMLCEHSLIVDKINTIIDAVNELKGAKNG